MYKNFGSARSSRRMAAFGAATLFTIAGIAGASWSAQGNGNAKAQAGRLQPVTASPATPSGSLFPGGSADTALTLTNPNPVAMTVSSIVGNGAITSDSAACDAAGHGVTFVSQSGAWEVAKNAALTVNLPDSVQMSLDSANECQGATFTVPVTVTASVSGQGGGGTTTTSTTAPAPAQFTWQPSSHVFPNAEVNTGNSTQSFALRNVGGLSAAVETGTLGNDDFLVAANNCTNVTLAPSQSCSIVMRFRPVATGARTGVMQARPAGSGAFASASLSGTGTAPASLLFQPPSHDYGGVATGAESSVFNFQVSNNSGTVAANFSPSIGGADPNSFFIRSSNCPVNLPPGAACVIGVSFRPPRAGSNNGTLRVSFGSSATSTQTATAALAGQGF